MSLYIERSIQRPIERHIQRPIHRPYNRYPKPFYPKGYGFWCINVIQVENQFVSNTNLYELAEKYFDVTRILTEVDDMMEHFKTTDQNIEGCHDEYVENHLQHVFDEYYMEKYNYNRDEVLEKNIRNEEDLKYEMTDLVMNDEEMNFWYKIGCRKNVDAVENFKSDIASAMANTIVNGMAYRLCLTPNEEISKKLKQFVEVVNKNFTIKWI